jgi:hypothetical protein
MSAGSGASNLGYGNIYPYNTSPFVNGTSSNYSGSFSSNEVDGLPGLAGAKSNIDAAAGRVPGICLFKGGSKNLKRKIKNITKHYKKMKGGSKKINSLKRKISRGLSRQLSRGRQFSRGLSRQLSRGFLGGRTRRHRRGRGQRGGYSQYQNNMPYTPGYQVAGVNLPAAQLGQANPPPITRISGECIDNYNHYTNMGFPSRGH